MTISTENRGSYANVTAAELKVVEPAIQTAAGNNNAYISAAKDLEGGVGYEVTATPATGGEKFTMETNKGDVSPTCSGTSGGCPVSKEW